jgi:hypothetical protein
VQFDRGSLALQPGDEGTGFLDQIGVEGPGQAAIRGEKDDRRLLRLAGRLTQKRKPVGEIRGVQPGDHIGQRVGVWTRGDHAILRALHLRRRNHLHRARDFARVLDGFDPSL